jgi:two-component system chemotaxis response regulator CheY
MKHILVIDDSATIRMSVEYALKEMGYPITQAENGKDALGKVKTLKGSGNDIAACVVDVNMPEMDGITFVREFRKDDKFTPVIMLTTESEEAKIKEGKDAGASGWLVKPFQPDQLVTVVKKLVR